jgi:hypothetical protein
MFFNWYLEFNDKLRKVEKAFQDDINENDQAVKEIEHKFLPKFELINVSQNEIFDKLDEIEEKVINK